MRKIGSYLKEQRENKNMSLFQMEKDTKIKKHFIDLIENGDWDNLPEYPVTSGFVKTIAKALDLNEDASVALLRREYPFEKKKVSINPKPDLKLKVTVSPKIVIIISSIFLVLLTLGYLAYQYIGYVSPPKLTVSLPLENQEVEIGETTVMGKTEPDVTLNVNNQRILVSETGEFSGKIGVDTQTKNITFIARSRYGRETVIVRDIVPVTK